MITSRVAAIVVTYNRKELLLSCIQSLQSQTVQLDVIYVIDNASSDGTEDKLRADNYLDSPKIVYKRLPENIGGAGGFSEGLKFALQGECDWFWLMDDDARADPCALERLLEAKPDATNLFGSIAVDGDTTAWPVVIKDGRPSRIIRNVVDLPAKASVNFIPFLGLFAHRDLVQRIGLPDAGFFLAADDVEYSLRALRSGSQCVQIFSSCIFHPSAATYRFPPFLELITCLKLSPWKRYYDTRNRLLIARQYYGSHLFTQTIPGSLLRLVAALCFESRRSAQTWAFLAGFIDGLAGRKGRRHERWRIGD
jgi:GT2 family glycosyltransferase